MRIPRPPLGTSVARRCPSARPCPPASILTAGARYASLVHRALRRSNAQTLVGIRASVVALAARLRRHGQSSVYFSRLTRQCVNALDGTTRAQFAGRMRCIAPRTNRAEVHRPRSLGIHVRMSDQGALDIVIYAGVWADLLVLPPGQIELVGRCLEPETFADLKAPLGEARSWQSRSGYKTLGS